MNGQLIRQLSDRISLKEAEQRRLDTELNTLNIRRSFVDGELSGLRVALDKANSLERGTSIAMNVGGTLDASAMNPFAPAPATRRI